MKQIFIVIFTGIIITSCGDTAQGPGEKAGEEHNRQTTAGTGEVHNNMEQDTSKADGNFHPKQKGGATPADGKGNWWGKDRKE